MADAPDDDRTPVDPALFRALAADPLAAHLGIELEEVRPGYARATMTVGPQVLNTVGTAHGGATMALLDVVHSAVSNRHGTGAGAVRTRPGTVPGAQDFPTEFLSAGRPGDRLVAEGHEVHRSSRTAVYRIAATTSDGRRGATRRAPGFRAGT